MYGTDWCWQTYGSLLYSVNTGKPAFPRVHGETFFEFLNNHPDAAETFNKAMTTFSEQETAALLRAYDFSAIKMVVDVGGGQGQLISAILKSTPAAHAILFEQEQVLEEAKELIARFDLRERCELKAGNFFTGVPEGADLYIFKEHYS